MLFARGFVGILLFGVWLYCLLDAITSDRARVRNLPKTAWVFLVLLTFEIGAIAWLVAGRPRQGEDPPRVSPPAGLARGPDDDPDFLAELRRQQQGRDG